MIDIGVTVTKRKNTCYVTQTIRGTYKDKRKGNNGELEGLEKVFTWQCKENELKISPGISSPEHFIEDFPELFN